MKNSITPRRRSFLLGLCLAAISTAATVAGTYSWDARSGLLPNQVDPTMRLVCTRATNSPVLTADGLLIHTEATDYEAGTYYIQETNDIAMPTQLVIEAEVKFVAEADHLPANDRDGATGITFFTATGVGNAVFIGPSNIWLWLGGNSDEPGPNTNVLTSDAFHRCRIEVDNPTNPGSTTRIFWDGALVLNSAVYHAQGNGAYAPRNIWFGDGTSGSSGTSYWRSFRHNAAARTAGTHLSIATAAELYWWAETNKTYQVQWKPQLGTNDWMNLGAPIPGDDSMKFLFDSTRGQPHKFYQVMAQ